MRTAGLQLRALREQMGLTMRDVEAASARIVERHGSSEYAISPSRLSDLEVKGLVPSIYRLYSLAVIYRRDLSEILAWYGVDSNSFSSDLGLICPPRSHRFPVPQNAALLQMPSPTSPDLRRTTNLGREVEHWGLIPLVHLTHLAEERYTYAYIGGDDLTMHPLLPPGSFVQVDESRNKITQAVWRTEYERPIYFVEVRGGYTCCWCTLKGSCMILQPHPLSPVPVRVLRYPQDAEVIGQVVGVAMRLGNSSELAAESKPRAAIN